MGVGGTISHLAQTQSSVPAKDIIEHMIYTLDHGDLEENVKDNIDDPLDPQIGITFPRAGRQCRSS